MVDAFSRHMDDEKDHLGIDEALLEVYWERSSSSIRWLNAQAFRLFVDEFSSQYLNGTVIDYKSNFQESGFAFENPNASGGCGCGSSFTV